MTATLLQETTGTGFDVFGCRGSNRPEGDTLWTFTNRLNTEDAEHRRGIFLDLTVTTTTLTIRSEWRGRMTKSLTVELAPSVLLKLVRDESFNLRREITVQGQRLAFMCYGEPEENGCGLFFCDADIVGNVHLNLAQLNELRQELKRAG